MGEGDAGQQEQRRDKCPTRIDKYLVGGMIGKGGFGSVYRAIDHEKALFVAIKQMGTTTLNSGDLGTIEMEVALLSNLKHRNIVKYIESIRTEYHLNIVLEYIEGGSLRSLVKRFQAIPESLCAIYTLQILNGLTYLHSQGVVHRDIKGANVLVTKRGIVKLADFGVATKLSEVDNSKRCVVGTPYWMAPEIIEMSPPTPQCDIWSVGGTVVEMITGSPPYFYLPQVSAMFRIVSDPHPPLPDCISPAIQSFLLACWEKNPGLRPGAVEMLEHEWIQDNRRRTLDFARSQKMRSPQPDREDEDEEEPDEDADAAETLMATVAGNQDLTAASAVSGPASPTLASSPNCPAADANSTSLLPSQAIQRSKRGNRACEDKRMISQGECASESAKGASMVETRVATPAQSRSDVGSGKFSGTVASSPRAPAASVTDVNGKTDRTPVQGERGKVFPPSSPSASAANECAKPPTQPGSSSEDAGPPETTDPGGGAADLGDYHCYYLNYLQKKECPESDCAAQLKTQSEEQVAPSKDHGKNTDDQPATLNNTVVERSVSNPRKAALAEPCPPQGISVVVPPGSSAPAGQRDAAEIKRLLGRIRPHEEPAVLVDVCNRLLELLQQGGNEESNLSLLMQYGAVPIVEMLQVPDPALLRQVLRMVNQLADGSQAAQEIFATVGLIPGVIKFARWKDLPHLRREAAHFIARLCNTSERSLQMLVACGGLEALADLAAHDYYNNRDLISLALDALVRIFHSASQNGRKNDFCRILAKQGLCGHLCILLDTLASDIQDRASQFRYLRIVVDLLLFFAKEGDAIVKVYMCKGPVLEGFLSSLEFLPPELSLQILKTFKWLAQEPSVLNMLENAGVVPALVSVLGRLSSKQGRDDTAVETEGKVGLQSVQDPCSQCLLALFYLCKLSRPRQEQAALSGAVPILVSLAEQGHRFKVYAFVMLCDMTSASLATRRILWSHGGLEVLVKSLRQPALQTFALEAVVGWAGVREHRADWGHRLEGVLLQEDSEFVPQLITLFDDDDVVVFMRVLEQLLKATRLSPRLNAAIAASDCFFQVVAQRLRPNGLAERRQPPVDSGELGRNILKTAAEGDEAPTPRPTGHEAPTPRSTGDGDGLVGASGALRNDCHAVVQDDVVRARKNLLRLLLQICQGQEGGQRLSDLCVRHGLPVLVKGVLLEEQRRQRVILCDLAKQLLELFRQALSGA